MRKVCRKKSMLFSQKKTVRLAVNFDKPFITAEIKKLDRLKKREYRKHHRSKKYLKLKGKFDEK